MELLENFVEELTFALNMQKPKRKEKAEKSKKKNKNMPAKIKRVKKKMLKGFAKNWNLIPAQGFRMEAVAGKCDRQSRLMTGRHARPIRSR